MNHLLKKALSLYKDKLKLLRVLFSLNIFFIISFQIVWNSLPEAHSSAIPGMILMVFLGLVGLPIFILNFFTFILVKQKKSSSKSLKLSFMPSIDIPLLIAGVLATMCIYSGLIYVLIGLFIYS